MIPMKKMFSVLLAIAMLFSLSPLTFAEDIVFTDVDRNTAVGGAVYKLVEDDVIKGYGDGTFQPNGFITRAEFAAVISRFKKLAIPEQGDALTGFPDVDDVNHWAKPYIKLAKDAGIISGFPEGVFRPDDSVTLEQAVKMVVSSIGYTDLSYPEGYMQVAVEKELLTDINQENGQTAPITRGNVALLVYHAGNVAPPAVTAPPTVEPTTAPTPTPPPTITLPPIPNIGGGSSGGGGGGGGGGGSSSSSDTITVRGKITQVSTTGLYDTYTGLDTLQVYLDADNDDYDGVYYVSKGSASFGVLDRYLGCRVKVTLVEDEEIYNRWNIKDNISTSETREISLNAKHFVTIEGNEFSYYRDEDATKESTVKLEFDKDDCPEPAIIYNGMSTEEFDLKYFENITDGKIRLLDNDQDGNYEVIFIDSYENYVVSQNSYKDRSISFFYGAAPITIPEADYERNVVITGDITATSSTNIAEAFDNKLKKISKYDVIRLRRSLDNETIFEIDVARKQYISKKLTRLQNDYVMIDGSSVKTEFSDLYLNTEHEDKLPKSELNLTGSFNFYLDRSNKIAFIEKGKVVKADSKYAYLYNITFDDEKTTLRLIPTDKPTDVTSVRKELTESSKITIDGKNFKGNLEGARNWLEDAATAINKDKSPERSLNDTFSQLIRYEESGGNITVIDTVLDATGALDEGKEEDEFNVLRVDLNYICDDGKEGSTGKSTFNTSPSASFKKTGVSKNLNVNSTTGVFYVPGNRRLTGEYSYKTFNSNNFQRYLSYYVEGYYTSTNALTAKFIVQYYEEFDREFNAYTDLGIVKQSPELTQDGYTLSLFTWSGGNTTISISDDLAEAMLADGLETGDVIRYTKKRVGTSSKFQMLEYKYALDISNPPIDSVDNLDDAEQYRVKNVNLYDDQAVSGNINSVYRMLYGTAYQYTTDGGKYLVVSKALASDTGGADMIEEEASHSSYLNFASGAKLFLYDEFANEDERLTTVISWSELQTVIDGSVDSADQVLVYSSEGKVRFVYIIRNGMNQLRSANRAYAAPMETAPVPDVDEMEEQEEGPLTEEVAPVEPEEGVAGIDGGQESQPPVEGEILPEEEPALPPEEEALVPDETDDADGPEEQEPVPQEEA